MIVVSRKSARRFMPLLETDTSGYDQNMAVESTADSFIVGQHARMIPVRAEEAVKPVNQR